VIQFHHIFITSQSFTNPMLGELLHSEVSPTERICYHCRFDFTCGRFSVYRRLGVCELIGLWGFRVCVSGTLSWF